MTHFCSILEDYPAIVVRFRLSRVRKWHLSKRHLMQNSPYLAYVSFSLKTKIHYLWELLGHLWGSHLWWWHSFPCFMCMNAVLPLYTDFVLELTEKDFGLSSESLWRSCLEGKKKKTKTTQQTLVSWSWSEENLVSSPQLDLESPRYGLDLLYHNLSCSLIPF